MDGREPRFAHEKFATILATLSTREALEIVGVIEEGHVDLYFKDGRYVSTLEPGMHAFWKNSGRSGFAAMRRQLTGRASSDLTRASFEARK